MMAGDKQLFLQGINGSLLYSQWTISATTIGSIIGIAFVALGGG